MSTRLLMTVGSVLLGFGLAACRGREEEPPTDKPQDKPMDKKGHLKDLPAGTRLKFSFPPKMNTLFGRFQNGAQTNHFGPSQPNNLPPLDEEKPHCTLVEDRGFPSELTVSNTIWRQRYTIEREPISGRRTQYAWFTARKTAGWRWSSFDMSYDQATRLGGRLDVHDVKLEGQRDSIFCTEGNNSEQEPTIETLRHAFGTYLTAIDPPANPR